MECTERDFCGRNIQFCEERNIITTESSVGGMSCILRREEEYSVHGWDVF